MNDSGQPAGRGRHRKYLPYAFTEHGPIMASSVLNFGASEPAETRKLGSDPNFLPIGDRGRITSRPRPTSCPQRQLRCIRVQKLETDPNYPPQAVPQVVVSDPDEDHVLAAAVAAGADLIASGDRRDLFPLGSYQDIPIVAAREALERLGL